VCDELAELARIDEIDQYAAASSVGVVRRDKISTE
jgi:hypothetical protein